MAALAFICSHSSTGNLYRNLHSLSTCITTKKSQKQIARNESCIGITLVSGHIAIFHEIKLAEGFCHVQNLTNLIKAEKLKMKTNCFLGESNKDAASEKSPWKSHSVNSKYSYV
jgi:hypothetical protein